jgi:hypothetical protein
MTETLRDDPRTSINWHIHRRGCPHYRERWLPDSDTRAGEPLYQVFCLMNTPPISHEEQSKCLTSVKACWRHKESATSQSTKSSTASDV